MTVRGRTGSNAGMTRHVAVLTVGQMHGLQIPEIDDPWLQHSRPARGLGGVVGADLRAPPRGGARASWSGR